MDYSPAALRLMRARIRVRAVAEAASLSGGGVSMMLSGKLRMSPEVIVAIRTLGGDQLSREVSDLATQARAAELEAQR